MHDRKLLTQLHFNSEIPAAWKWDGVDQGLLSVSGLNRIKGFQCRLPEGAFYAFPNISELGIPSAALASRILNEAGVACLSGTDFGARGENYLRFSYANSLKQLELAVERIGNFVSALPDQ